MVSGFDAFIKNVVFVCNFVVWVCGLALISLGSYLQHVNKTYLQFSDQDYLTIPILLICIGCLATVAGFLGCWGAIRQSRNVLKCNAVFLVIMCICEITVSVFAFQNHEQLKSELANPIFKSMKNYNKSSDAKEMWDSIQVQLQCCGALNQSDWIFLALSNNLNITIPDDFKSLESFDNEAFDKLNPGKDLAHVFKTIQLYDQTEVWLPNSCCGNFKRKCTSAMKEEIQIEGCLTKLVDWINHNVTLLGCITVGLAFLQIISVVVSCYLVCAFNEEKDENRQQFAKRSSSKEDRDNGPRRYADKGANSPQDDDSLLTLMPDSPYAK